MTLMPLLNIIVLDLPFIKQGPLHYGAVPATQKNMEHNTLCVNQVIWVKVDY